MQLDKLKSFKWSSLGNLTSQKSMNDVNDFIEGLPQKTNNTLLIITAVIWGVAATMGLYTTIKMQELAEISVDHEEATVLLPVVPKIQDKAVPSKDVKSFVDKLQGIYKGLEINVNSSSIVIRAKSTAQFGQFREAIGHVQNGGSGWRVDVDRLCIGKECKQYPLSATLKINKVSVVK